VGNKATISRWRKLLQGNMKINNTFLSETNITTIKNKCPGKKDYISSTKRT
jgi:hypothetical protein